MKMKSDKKTTTDNKAFLQNGNDLFEKMTAYMPRCYFPTTLGENALQELAGKEFRRVRDIICRECRFDETGCIERNAGVSPFDLVREPFEREVHRRIRKDYTLLSVISVRESLIEKIRCAVEKEDNIIGTFYQNRGAHYRDAEFPEYDTSPIVVIHNSGFYGYGGYESATVYELFIDKAGRLLCTLNGEAGEDFDEPVGHVQIEGLFEIVHWLEEYGFIPDDDDRITVCDECGSTDIQTQAWVDPNTRLFIDFTGIDRDDNWCDECEEHLPFCFRKEFKERMQKWWAGLAPSELEHITGLSQSRTTSRSGFRKFAEACNKWWNRKSYDEKRVIWKEHNNDE